MDRNCNHQLNQIIFPTGEEGGGWRTEIAERSREFMEQTENKA